MSTRDLTQLPPDLPAPVDDGAAAHLPGMRVPSIALESTRGGPVDLSALPGWAVVATYPRTGVPGHPPIDPHWDAIPGARGCTPQLMGYAALREIFQAKHCRLFALSAQDSDYQQEMAQRLALGFPVLSDRNFRLTDALRLPTRLIAGQRLLKRLSLILLDGRIVHVEYPAFPPDQNAEATLHAFEALQSRMATGA